MRENKKHVIRQMQELMEEEFVVLDVETTGLGPEDEVVALGLVSKQGHVLMDKIISTTKPSNDKALAVHGIGPQRVLDEGVLWADVLPGLLSWVRDFPVVSYCTNYFDAKMVVQSCINHNTPVVDLSRNLVQIMNLFAVYFGEWNDYRQSYKWQKLETALLHFDLEPQQLHTAAGDALATLRVVEAIASTKT